MIDREGNRGGRLVEAGKKGAGREIGRKIIVTIGIDAYKHIGKLQNAVGDARGIHEYFTESLGFEAPFAPLLDAEATKTAIITLLEDRLPDEVGEDDALLFFFAGHGKARGRTDRARGYLAPVEARQNHWADYIRIREFLNVLNDLPARHIIAIVDACRSGFALGQAMVHTRSSELPHYVSDLQGKKSRRVLTSAMANQEAFDDGPVRGHSLFTGCLIHGLRSGLADMDGNGIITTSELGEYVRTVVGEESDGKQTPDYGRFAPFTDERGELVFTDLALGQADSEAVSPLQHILDLEQWLEDEEKAPYARALLQKLAEGSDPVVAVAAQDALRQSPAPQLSVVRPLLQRKKHSSSESLSKSASRRQPPVRDQTQPVIRTFGELEFVEVPAGKFWMGSDEEYEEEKPRHEVDLDTYWISRTAITNEQYRKFVSAAGHDDPEHWVQKVYEERERKIWIFTRAEKVLVDESIRFPVEKADHPVVYISWHDAMAYCRWLSGETDAKMALPSEAEWEKAARGVEGFVYPWGDLFDAERCNTDESAVGDTTPVDNYPRGASPYGALDMSSNVWEWTRTIHSDRFGYKYAIEDGRENRNDKESERVVRGGAWDFAADFARAAFRNSAAPHLCNDNLGFRVVIRRLPTHFSF